MTRFLGTWSLFRKIMLSFVLASVFFLTLLTLVAYYSNERLEDDLLTRQMAFELENILDLLASDPQARLPRSASLRIYLDSRRQTQPVPTYLEQLDIGEHHDIRIDDKAYHVLIAAHANDRIYIQYDITEIESSEAMMSLILLIAWMVLVVVVFFIAMILSRKLSEPIHRLSEELDRLNPDERGIQLGHHFERDEVGRIARAFDAYSQKVDDYVEKQIRFAAMASHELRSPLTIVQTSADLIACHETDAAIAPYIEKIRRATATMSNMIHALLAVTRDKPVHASEAAIGLCPLVDEILETVAAEARGRQVRIDNNLDPDTSVCADRTLLTVVLTNLIRNGIKHGEQSSIRIDLQGNCLTIADNGYGIDAEELKHIFDFAYRGQGSQGYGVGLYISRLVCDYLGWRLDLEANPGGGTVAKIEFTA